MAVCHWSPSVARNAHKCYNISAIDTNICVRTTYRAVHLAIDYRMLTTNLEVCTVLVLRMAHRIWKETKQQPGTAVLGNMLGCCLVSFHILWAILSTSTVVVVVDLAVKRNFKFNVNIR